MKKTIQFTAVLYILMFGLHFNAKAQTSRDALQEIGRIKAFYYYLDTTGIYKIGYYEVQDSTGYKRDTIYETCTAHKGSYYRQSVITYPGTHLITQEVNNSDYNIHVDVIDSVIQVNNSVSLESSMVVIDFFGGDFYVNNIDSILVYDTTGGRKINVSFNTNSPYILYELYYDSANYSIKTLKIRIKTGEYLGGPLISTMTWICTHTPFSSESFEPELLFRSSKYFIRLNKEYVLQTPYTDFELINTSGK